MYRKGFTLIELLIVIAIIGVLSSIILNAIQQARMKARDARRKSDIHQLQIALESYYSDNGMYPCSYNALAPNSSWSTSNDGSWTTDPVSSVQCTQSLHNQLAPYMTLDPHDPLEEPAVDSSSWAGDGFYAYSYHSYRQPPDYFGCPVGSAYIIVYRFEIAAGPDPGVKMCNDAMFPTPFRYGGSGANTYIKTVGVSPDNPNNFRNF
jgi:prepilin-type N-terminal cleavage/methylation domain-containing protein